MLCGYVSYIIVTLYLSTLKNRIIHRYYKHAYCRLSYKPFINNNLNKISSNIKINKSKLFKCNIIINVSYAFSIKLVFTAVIFSIIC